MKAVRFIILAILALCAPGLADARTEQSVNILVKEFETTKVFWQRFEIAKQLVRGAKIARSQRSNPGLAMMTDTLDASRRLCSPVWAMTGGWK